MGAVAMQFGCTAGSGLVRGGMVVLALAACVGARGALAQGVSPTTNFQCFDPQGRILREMKDPHTGERWLLISNPRNPAGPGRLVIASGIERLAGATHAEARALAIHAGDRVVIEEHTATLEAYFDAVALETAAIGSSLKARLKIGGRVARAVAIGPGRAALAP